MEITHAMVRAASESRARDDEGEFESLGDLLGFSGENKTHTAIRAALEAALRVSHDQAWRDIATAPEDGTWFIALQDGETYPCEWHTEEPDEGPPHSGWFDHFNRSFEGPTHWQPAPEATPLNAPLSSSGRTTAFEAVNSGSNPDGGSTAPVEATRETPNA